MSRRATYPTAREVQCLRALIKTGHVKGAAQAVGVSYKTIGDHLMRMREILGLHSLYELVAYQARKDLIQEALQSVVETTNNHQPKAMDALMLQVQANRTMQTKGDEVRI